jgi:hypothetical protein
MPPYFSSLCPAWKASSRIQQLARPEVSPASFLFNSIRQAGLRTNGCDYPELPVPLGCDEQVPPHTFAAFLTGANSLDVAALRRRQAISLGPHRQRRN